MEEKNLPLVPFYIRSATKLIIAQAKEEQTLVRTQRIQKNVD